MTINKKYGFSAKAAIIASVISIVLGLSIGCFAIFTITRLIVITFHLEVKHDYNVVLIMLPVTIILFTGLWFLAYYVAKAFLSKK